MNSVENVSLQCPYCWEMIDLFVDCSVENQSYIEDCQVCCKAIEMTVIVDESGQPQVTARHENS